MWMIGSVISGWRNHPPVRPHERFARRQRGSAFRPVGLFAADGAVERVDQVLNFDEFGPCAFRLVAVVRRGEHLGMGIAVLEHAFARLFQRIQPFAHVDLTSRVAANDASNRSLTNATRAKVVIRDWSAPTSGGARSP